MIMTIKITFEKINMPQSKNIKKYTDNRVEKIILLRAKQLGIIYKNVQILLESGIEIYINISRDEANDTIEINFNNSYEIQNLKSIKLNLNLQKQEDYLEDNKDSINKDSINKENIINDKDVENHETKNEKEERSKNKKETNSKYKEKTKKDNQKVNDSEKDKQIIKTNNIKLVVIKILIVAIFLMLSIIIILFVRIKSIQKKRANYVELTGLDSI